MIGERRERGEGEKGEKEGLISSAPGKRGGEERGES